MPANALRKSGPLTFEREQLAAAYHAKSDTSGRDSVVQFIVRLRTSPGAKNAAGRTTQASLIDEEHQQFLLKLNDISGSNARTTSGEIKMMKVVREFKKSFNGFTLKANRSFSDAIKKMPYVISVTEDRKVKSNDVTSNAVINVPKVWQEVGATGKGVLIGIIDTGIDYGHPDLGSGFGIGHKVVGGYDFVNNDDDPLDDNGHGTHVAGIAAANGELKGVAPDATLMAIKVLDQYGSGWDSWILAGIEYAVDPDGNPFTDDAPDVVNMSLGRTPDEFEPMSEAVNNAVASGISFVIAAGNSGEYMQIGTPGIAEQAITVAAIDNYDYTAGFSSRGPVPGTFYLKPDVAAPGVSINSTFPGATYESLDGTSMASPHVTGVVALMRGKHPDWEPVEVKAALMSTARNGGYDKILETGAGIVDAYEAITTDLIMSPGSISYGKPETSSLTWRRQDIITVANKGALPQSVTLALEGMTGGGITVQVSPAQFTLASGASREVSVDITVVMSQLETKVIPDAYLGAVILSAGDKKSKTLLSLFNPAITTLQFSEIPSSLIIGGVDVAYWQPIDMNSTEVDVTLPVGTYDILTWYYDKIVIVEDYVVDAESSSIFIDFADAKNRIDFQPVDANGTPLPLEYGVSAMTGPTTFTLWSGPMPGFYLSDIKKYKFFTRIFSVPENPEKLYEIGLSTGDEITSSRVISNDPNDFTQMTITNPTIPEGGTQDLIFYGVALSFGTWNPNPSKIPNPANVYVFDDPTDETFTFYRMGPSAGFSGFNWETSMLNNDPLTGLGFSEYWGTPIRSFDHDPFNFKLGGSLVNFTGVMSNGPTYLTLSETGVRGVYSHAFGERTSGAVTWSLEKSGEEVRKGTLLNALMDEYTGSTVLELDDVDEGAYKLTLGWNSYYVGGRFSNVTTELSFGTAPNDYFDHDPPFIQQYVITSEGLVTNHLDAGKEATISLSVADYGSSIASTSLEMREVNDVSWSQLVLTPGEGSYYAAIPTNIRTGLYSLRLTSTDVEGNSIVHTMEPAFVVGKETVTVPYTKVALISPINYDENASTRPTFTWSEIPGADYTFQLSTTDKFDDLVADDDVDEATRSLNFDLEKDKVYYWRVGANVSGVQVPWSKTFIFKTSVFDAPTLLSPRNNAIDVPTSPTILKWTPAPGADWQILELSTNAEFSDIYYSYGAYNGMNELWLTFLDPSDKVYWRVKSLYSTFYNNYEVSSEVFIFRTQDIAEDDPGSGDPGDGEDNDDDDPDVVTGLEDDEALKIFPNPFTDRTYIRLVSNKDGLAKVTLLDQLGRQVRASQHQLSKGENILTIEAGSGNIDAPLQQGMYVVVIETGETEPKRVKVVRK